MSPTPWYNKPRHLRWCPELALFPEGEARRLAVKRASTLRKKLGRLAALIVAAALAGALSHYVIASLGGSVSAFLQRLGPALRGGLVGGVLGVLFGGGFALWWRPTFRQSLREQLVEAGIAVCLKCGYDLRGQTEPRCPECGTTFDERLLTPDHDKPSRE